MSSAWFERLSFFGNICLRKWLLCKFAIALVLFGKSTLYFNVKVTCD